MFIFCLREIDTNNEVRQTEFNYLSNHCCTKFNLKTGEIYQTANRLVPNSLTTKIN